MADLSQYVDFNFKIDLSGNSPVCVITDISSYPSGVSAFQGFVAITQPDGITTSPNFSSPDITSANLSASKPYRTAIDTTPQNGNYVIIYTVKCAGYDDTILTKTFTLSYNRPALVITPITDVFTPLIKASDNTNYNQINFEAPAVTRSWAVSVNKAWEGVETITGTAKELDLAYNGNYFDAAYSAELTCILNYSPTSFSWVTLTDKIVASIDIDIYAPKSISILQSAIDAMNSCGCNTTNTNQQTAQSLLYQMNMQGNLGNTIGLQTTEINIEKILYPYSTKTHTNNSIQPYMFTSIVTYETEWESFAW